MRGINKLITTAGLLGIALLPALAAVPPDPPATPRDGRIPVAIAQPLAAIDSSPILVVRTGSGSTKLSEPGMLVLVGSALLGLAAIVRKAT